MLLGNGDPHFTNPTIRVIDAASGVGLVYGNPPPHDSELAAIGKLYCGFYRTNPSDNGSPTITWFDARIVLQTCHQIQPVACSIPVAIDLTP